MWSVMINWTEAEYYSKQYKDAFETHTVAPSLSESQKQLCNAYREQIKKVTQ